MLKDVTCQRLRSTAYRVLMLDQSMQKHCAIDAQLHLYFWREYACKICTQDDEIDIHITAKEVLTITTI